MKNGNDNITRYAFYDDDVKEQFYKLGKEVLDFLDFFRKNYKFDSTNSEILIAKVKQTRLYFNSVLCQVNGKYFDIFFSEKCVNVEGRDERLYYKKDNGYVLEDKTYRLDNGGSLTLQSHLPYNITFAFPNGKYYKVHLECDIENIDKKIVEYFHQHIPYANRVNELLKMLLSLINIDNCVIEIKGDKDLIWFENGKLKQYTEYFEKDNIKYHLYLKDNEIYVEKTIIETEKINEEEIIDVKKYKKVM